MTEIAVDDTDPSRLRVAMVVFSYRYTGAAAVAEHSCRAVRSVGVDASLIFVAGDNLEQRLRDQPWAYPGLVKERGFSAIRANLRTLRTVASQTRFVISFLPHDHLLCAVAGVHRRSLLVRSFRHQRHLRRDPYHRRVARTARGVILAHRGMQSAFDDLAIEVPSSSFPVPLEDRFQPAADQRWRQRLGLPQDAPTIGMVGKVAPARGFDLLLEIASRLNSNTRTIIVGHGEARSALEDVARNLGVAERIHWAGYHEDELPGLMATMDVVLFLAAGSDHGHRAISEAQGCARAVVAAATPGVEDLIENGETGLIVAADADGLAAVVAGLLENSDERARLGRAAAEAAEGRRFGPSGEQLKEYLEELVAAVPG